MLADVLLLEVEYLQNQAEVKKERIRKMVWKEKSQTPNESELLEKEYAL